MFKQKYFNARVSVSVAMEVISKYADITVKIYSVTFAYNNKTTAYQSVLCKKLYLCFNEVHTYLMTVLQML